MDKASVRKSNEQRLPVESSNCPQISLLSQKPLDSAPSLSTPDSVNSKSATEPKAPSNDIQIKVPNIANRVRSESVPRTIRTLKVTATVTPSPVLNRKIMESDVGGGKPLVRPLQYIMSKKMELKT